MYAFVDALPGQWDRYRRGSITELVGRIYGEVKGRRPGLVVSAAVFPDWRSAARWKLQEWAAWLSEGIVDVAVPMAYTRDVEEFAGWMDGALAAAGAPERVWAGIGAYRNPVEVTVEQIGRARSVGGERDRDILVSPGSGPVACGGRSVVAQANRRSSIPLRIGASAAAYGHPCTPRGIRTSRPTGPTTFAAGSTRRRRRRIHFEASCAHGLCEMSLRLGVHATRQAGLHHGNRGTEDEEGRMEIVKQHPAGVPGRAGLHGCRSCPAG